MASSDERLHRLVDGARHDSVTVQALTEKKAGIGRPRLADRPLITYLKSGEQPHFILYGDRKLPRFYGRNAPRALQRSRRYEVMHMVTDTRWIMVAGNRNGDDSLKLPLQDITAINYSTEGIFSSDHLSTLSHNKVVLETEIGFLEIPVSSDFTGEDLASLTEYLHEVAGVTAEGVELDPDDAGYTIDGVDVYVPDEQTIARLLDEVPPEAEAEADQIVQESDNVHTLVTRLNELVEAHEESAASLENQVAESTSVADLRVIVESPIEHAQRRAEEEALRVRDRAEETFRDADPEEVGRWALDMGLSTRGLARMLPGPTLFIQLATLAAGGVMGAHTSANENSVLSAIDPDELARHAIAMSSTGAELDHIDGEAVGALLGMSSYLGRTMAPDEYAKWVVEADPRALLEGAEWGASYATELNSTSRRGAVTGATLGLAYSYASDTQELDLKEIVDADLYKKHLDTTTSPAEL